MDAQTKVSSGKKVIKPSDDPVAAADIVRLSGEQSESDQFSRNIAAARSRLTIADGALDNVEQIIEQIRANGLATLGEVTDPSAYVSTIVALRDQIQVTANTTHQGRYIFGGGMTNSAPEGRLLMRGFTSARFVTLNTKLSTP